jgi:hypothetical protein
MTQGGAGANKFGAAATRHGYEKATTSDRRVEATDEKIAA